MYQPPHFIEDNRDVLHALIRAHPLGLLISSRPDGPVANLAPFLLDADVGPHGRLRAHLARPNEQWRLIQANPDGKVLVVFQGVEGYITPSWYEAKREHGKVVPTWNYVTVQARGRATVHEDAAWLRPQIEALTRTHEAGRDDPWAVSDAPDNFIAAQMRGIVGVEIEIAELTGKWKVSQNRPVADRAGVAEGLGAEPDSAEMQALVRRYGGLDGAG